MVEGLALCPSPTGVPIAGHPFRPGESPHPIGLQLLGVLVVSCTSLARLLALRQARSWKCPRAQESHVETATCVMCPAGHDANHGATHHLQNDKHRQLHHYKKGIFNFKISRVFSAWISPQDATPHSPKVARTHSNDRNAVCLERFGQQLPPAAPSASVHLDWRTWLWPCFLSGLQKPAGSECIWLLLRHWLRSVHLCKCCA